MFVSNLEISNLDCLDFLNDLRVLYLNGLNFISVVCVYVCSVQNLFLWITVSVEAGQCIIPFTISGFSFLVWSAVC